MCEYRWAGVANIRTLLDPATEVRSKKYCDVLYHYPSVTTPICANTPSLLSDLGFPSKTYEYWCHQHHLLACARSQP